MTIALSPRLTFGDFLKTCPTDGRYEFVEDEIVRILATRQHDNVADFLAKIIDREVDQSGLDYRVSGGLVW